MLIVPNRQWKFSNAIRVLEFACYYGIDGTHKWTLVWEVEGKVQCLVRRPSINVACGEYWNCKLVDHLSKIIDQTVGVEYGRWGMRYGSVSF